MDGTLIYCPVHIEEPGQGIKGSVLCISEIRMAQYLDDHADYAIYHFLHC